MGHFSVLQDQEKTQVLLTPRCAPHRSQPDRTLHPLGLCPRACTLGIFLAQSFKKTGFYRLLPAQPCSKTNYTAPELTVLVLLLR